MNWNNIQILTLIWWYCDIIYSSFWNNVVCIPQTFEASELPVHVSIIRWVVIYVSTLLHSFRPLECEEYRRDNYIDCIISCTYRKGVAGQNWGGYLSIFAKIAEYKRPQTATTTLIPIPNIYIYIYTTFICYKYRRDAKRFCSESQ